MLSVSVTTRAPRPGEEEGVHYFFRTREAFEQLIAENRLLEYANTTVIITVRRRTRSRAGSMKAKTCCWKLRMQGAEQVLNHRSDCVSILYHHSLYC